MFFLVEPLKYIPELLPGFIMSVRRGRKGYDKPSQKVTRYMYSLVAKQCFFEYIFLNIFLKYIFRFNIRNNFILNLNQKSQCLRYLNV